ncbi:MAG: hypothetical protein DMG13_02070 [Acidobacteria bacterium]|nr:MAG: hypothetical protein DMG13_02070 [Acidobacteriota bacterium]
MTARDLAISTSWAATGVVKKLDQALCPSLHYRKEGWPSDQKNYCEASAGSRGRGGFPMRTKGKPPRLRQLRWLREIYLMTQPPLLAVMQGGA